MKIKPDWKKIVTKAWSVRAMIAAAIFSALEVIFGIIDPIIIGIPRGLFAVLSGITTALAFVLRLVAQKEFEETDDEQKS